MRATRQLGSSERRDAITAPADPPQRRRNRMSLSLSSPSPCAGTAHDLLGAPWKLSPRAVGTQMGKCGDWRGRSPALVPLNRSSVHKQALCKPSDVGFSLCGWLCRPQRQGLDQCAATTMVSGSRQRTELLGHRDSLSYREERRSVGVHTGLVRTSRTSRKMCARTCRLARRACGSAAWPPRATSRWT